MELTLGKGYKNDHACSTFISYIAKEQTQSLRSSLLAAKFFSLQADGANVENELFTVQYFDPRSNDCNDCKGHVHNRCFAILRDYWKQLCALGCCLLELCLKRCS